MTAILNKFLNKFQNFFQPERSDRLEILAVPGMTTLMDLALFFSFEPQLTATVTSAHNLLHCWLDIKRQSSKLLKALRDSDSKSNLELLGKQALDASGEAIEKLTTDPFAKTVNEDSEDEDVVDTGRRTIVPNRHAWESSILFCPDYIWADEAFLCSQRLVKQLLKHPFVVRRLEHPDAITNDVENEAYILFLVLTADLPARLVQFRASIEANSVVTKRLYVIKSEYRYPFRDFLEIHQTLQKAPSMELIQEYIQLPKQKTAGRKELCKQKLDALLNNPVLVEALALEQKMDEFETSMSKALYPFSELARFLDQKRAHLMIVDGILEAPDIVFLREILRRLKAVLCRKSGSESSTGIRPILLDLQGEPRDEERLGERYFTKDHNRNLEMFLQQLSTLAELCQTRAAFATEKRSGLEIPASISRGCSELDEELFSCQFQDWMTMVLRQHELTSETNFHKLAERLRRAEIQNSLAGATNHSLQVVQQRLEAIASDREQRFRVLTEVLEEVCLREMNMAIRVLAPEKQAVLTLRPTTATGIFGMALKLAGEPLPLG